MNTKKKLFIDLDKQVAGTFISFKEDNANPDELKVNYVSMNVLFPFSFGDRTSVTPYTVRSEDIRELSATEPDQDIDGFVGDMVVIVRNDGKFVSRSSERFKQRAKKYKERNEDLKSRIKDLEQEIRELQDSKEKESRNSPRRRSNYSRDGSSRW